MKMWPEILGEIQALLNDVDGTEYEEDHLVIWWNNAQVRLAVAKPQTRHQVYKCDDGNGIPLPEYHYMPDAVFVSGVKQPLKRLATRMALLDPSEVGFYLREEKIWLSGFKKLPQTWLYIYQSYFPKVPISEKGRKKAKVHAPEWAHEALVYYVGIQAMSARAADDASYRQYTAPPDATGTPVHNPYLKVAEYYEQRFYAILGSHADDDESFR